MKAKGSLIGGLVWVAIFVGSAVGQSLSSDPFRQDPMTDGVVSIEAEHWHAITPFGAHTWTNSTYVNDTRVRGVYAWPDTDQSVGNDFVGASPRVDYQVEFNRAGVHYVVIRGAGSGGDNDCHVGLNGQAVDSADDFSGFGYYLGWRTGNDPDSFVVVPSPGVHTLNIWMRDDGFFIDKIVVSSTDAFEPEGEGPPESLQGDPVVEAPEQIELTGLSNTNQFLMSSFTPVSDAETYEVLTANSTGEVLLPDPNCPTYGFTFLADPASDVQIMAVRSVPLAPDKSFGGVVLNRLAYGPTPELVDRVIEGAGAIGPDAYLAEQIAPEGLVERVDGDPVVAALDASLALGTASLYDLRAWYVHRAVGADRQLLEILSQFFSNHFVTYFWKVQDYFEDSWNLDENSAHNLAAKLEYTELKKWREVLLDPNGTFHDLLRISAESLAMIVYLDTVENGKDEPNENYAREILELFTMGVDNGYEQEDIEEMARVWTGWTIGPVDAADVGNPFASTTTTETLFPAASTGWQWRKGTAEPGANWVNPGWTPGAEWSTGQAPIGYGDNDDNTVLSDMRNNYSTVYCRYEFTLANPAELQDMVLRLYVDDGCMAYLNGEEVGRVRVDAGVDKDFDDFADDVVDNATWHEFPLSGVSSAVAGENVLAIRVLNYSLGSSDLSIDAEIVKPGVFSFLFDAGNHDVSNKVVFAGKTIHPRFGPPYAGQSYELDLDHGAGTNGIADGYAVLEHLSGLPYTAEYLCSKLLQVFVHEGFRHGGYYNVSNVTAETRLLKDCIDAWFVPGPDGRTGNIRNVLSTIFASDMFRGREARRNKVKTPFEYAVSCVRAVRHDLGGGTYSAWTDGYDLEEPMEYAGMELFARFTPNGWPEEGVEWIDTSTISERIRFVQHFARDPLDPAKEDDYGFGEGDNACDPVALMQAPAPIGLSGDLGDADVVADFFLRLIYPGEGSGNQDLERMECVRLLDSDANGDALAGQAFADLAVGSAAYEQRVRAMVGLLLSGPRFHEQ